MNYPTLSAEVMKYDFDMPTISNVLQRFARKRKNSLPDSVPAVSLTRRNKGYRSKGRL